MKIPASLLLILLSTALPINAAKEVLVFGDSLSKEYGVEFAHLDAVNWIEILDKERHEDFDNGSFRVYPDFRGTGRKYNWSFPGATSDDMLDNLTGDGFFQEIAQDEIKDHLRKEVNRVVIFLGGNDLEEKYRRLYNNDPLTQQIMDRIYNNLSEIVRYVKRRNANLEIVLVNVPHIGATPKIQKEHGTDLVNVAYATAAIEGLNTRLAQFARDEGIGHADVYRITKDLLDDKPFCISGVRFLNESNNNAGKFYLWLGGTLGAEFHPNTNGQALVANAIIEAFNEHYDAGIVPLGGTEILQELLSIAPDRSFEEWAVCYDLAPLDAPFADADGDGWDNLTEFVFDTDPSKADLPFVRAETPYQLHYRPRVRASEHFTVRLETSTDLISWNPVASETLTDESFGTVRWTLQDDPGPRIFTRFVLSKP